MKVSLLNGQHNIGIDLSSQGATVFEITKQDFEKIKAKTHRLEGEELVEIPVEPSPLCTIDIPDDTTDIPDIDAKITKVLKRYHGNILSTNIEIDGALYQRLYNIHIDRVQDFLTQSEYNAFSAPELGVIFDQKIIDLFSS